MSDIVRPSVPSLPTLPLTSDAPETFSSRADAVVAALNSVGTGASGLGTYLEHVSGRAALTSGTWPAFSARTTSGYSWSSAPATMFFAQEDFDNGSVFNGQFYTAPVSGLHLFALTLGHATPVEGALSIGIFVVGGSLISTSTEFAKSGAAGTNNVSCQALAYVSAGQQVGAQIVAFGAAGMAVDGLYTSIFSGVLLP